MALIDQVKLRIPTQTLAALTRSQSAGISTIDDTLLGAACDDIELGDFLTYAQQTFDLTNRQHLGIAIEGVMWKLRSWLPTKPDGLNAERDRFLARCKDLARVTSRDVVTPTSVQSGLRPTDNPNRETFDTRRFRDLIPDPPPPSDSSDD